MIRRLPTALLAVVLLCYPFLVYWGVHKGELTTLGVGLLLLFALRLLPVGGRLGEWLWLGRSIAGCGLLLAGLSLLCRASHWLLYYPVLVSLLMLLLFARSLWQPQTLIERLARLQDPQLPPEAIRYTRRVTQVWCGFFVVNGTLALGTILLGDMALWSLYNGLLSYLLMGTLMGGEWLLRRRLQARLATSMLEAQP